MLVFCFGKSALDRADGAVITSAKEQAAHRPRADLSRRKENLLLLLKAITNSVYKFLLTLVRVFRVEMSRRDVTERRGEEALQKGVAKRYCEESVQDDSAKRQCENTLRGDVARRRRDKPSHEVRAKSSCEELVRRAYAKTLFAIFV